MILQSARASPGAGRNERWREILRPELVMVPSFSPQPSAGRWQLIMLLTLSVPEVDWFTPCEYTVSNPRYATFWVHHIMLDYLASTSGRSVAAMKRSSFG